jgi:hypothetical protein
MSIPREFYMHKLRTLDDMSSYKKEFIIKVIEIIATSSYLAKAMKGSIPEEIKELLARVNK